MKIVSFYQSCFVFLFAFLNVFTTNASCQIRKVDPHPNSLANHFTMMAMDYVDSPGNLAELYAIKAIDFAYKSKDPKDSGNAYNALALWQQSNSLFSNALSSYDSVIFYAGLANDYFRLNTAYNNKGVIYRQQQAYEPAVAAFEKSLQYAYSSHDSISIAYCLSNIGNTYAVQNIFDKALFYYIKSYNILKQLPDAREQLPYIHNNIAGIYKRMHKYEFAISQYKLAYSVFFEYKNYNAMLSLSTSMAETFLDWEKPLESLKCIEDGIKLCNQNSDIAQKEAFYHQAYKTFLANNKITEALSYLELYSLAKEMNYDSELKRMLVETNQKFEVDKITRQKKEQQKNIKQQRITIIFMALGIVLIMVIAVLFAINFIQKTKLNKQLLQKNSLIETQNRQINESIEYARQILDLQKTSSDATKLYVKGLFIWDQPKDAVGGDFYLIKEKNSCLFFAVGDCTGHGAAGGFLAATYLRLLNRAISESNDGPANVLTRLNQMQSDFFGNADDESLQQLRSCAISILMIDKTTGTIRFASGAHKIAIVCKGIAKVLYNEKIALGSNDMIEFSEQEFTFEKSDKVYMFSDGLTDQLNSTKSKKLTTSGLLSILSQLHDYEMTEIQASVKNHFNEWKGTQQQTDDILFIGMEF